jgi:transposase
VSIDPYEAYGQAIQNELPWARIVVDHFHLVRGENAALDSIRRDRQRERATRRPKGIREQAHRDRLEARGSTAPAICCSRRQSA